MYALVSIIILIICIKYRRPYFLVLLPLYHLAGLLFTKMYLPVELNFIVSYAELFLLFFFVLEERLKDKTSFFLLIFPLLSAPSLMYAGNHMGYSLFIMLALLMTPWLYEYLKDNMRWMIDNKIPDLMIISWISLSILKKLYIDVNYSLPGQMFGLHGLLERGGGILASNYIGGILLMLLPFVQSGIINALCNIYLLVTFSRGVYASMLIYWTYKMLLSPKSFVKLLIVMTVALCLMIVILPKPMIKESVDYIKLRTVGTEQSTGIKLGDFVSIDSVKEKLLTEDRITIQKFALSISQNTNFIGVGLGGFRWGLESIGEPPEYSNAHNLYLTLLAEGGLLFLIGYIILYMYMVFLSYNYSSSAMLSLIIFGFYGLFNGELYEASGMASAINYYIIIFILAYLKYCQKQQFTHE